MLVYGSLKLKVKRRNRKGGREMLWDVNHFDDFGSDVHVLVCKLMGVTLFWVGAHGSSSRIGTRSLRR